jgi:hypothetical protein
MRIDRRAAAGAALLVLASGARSAAADRGHFGWLGGTDVLAAREVEVQVRVTERNDLGDTQIREAALWIGPAIGVTDRLELTLPAELSRRSAIGLPPDFALRRYGAELRYRFADTTPAPAVAPLLRFAVQRDVIRRDLFHAELDGAVSLQRGCIFAAAEVGVIAEINFGGLHIELRPGAGVSVGVGHELRLGAEVHAEIDRDPGGTRWLAAGPSLGWVHGRSWLAGTYAIGISSIASAPRLAWGIAF